MMLPGYQNTRRVNAGDTAELSPILYGIEETPIPVADIASVVFTVQYPNGDQVSDNGTLIGDGTGFYRWADTEQVGKYHYVARFTLTSGEVRSTQGMFGVVDPFNLPELTAMERVEDAVWLRLEDCFDSDIGGPWLRDMTLSYFNKTKVSEFISEALFDINMSPPATSLSIGEFTTLQPDGSEDPESSLLVQGVLLATIRHLMRAYVEQPLLSGAQVVFDDRRDYLQRWQTIYTIEAERYARWIALFKRQYVGNHRATLVSAKAGRLLPAPLRSRNIGRGRY
jgi:hypothetical protein